MNRQCKIATVVATLIVGSQLVVCSVSPKDTRSLYYSTELSSSKSAKIEKQSYSVKHSSPINQLNGSIQSKLWQHYQSWKGTPYAYGGSSKSGIDCSAFVQVTMNRVANINLPRTTRTQINQGQSVRLSQLKPGDLVFFQTGANQLHNGVYMGNGQFMHASSTVGVTVSELQNVYWQPRYLKSVRVI